LNPKKEIGDKMMIERMKELRRLLKEASEAYYNESGEIMSNKEYDDLYDELRSLEAQHGAAPDSPTVQIGAPVRGGLAKEKHEKPALSLDKTKSIKDLEDWLGNEKSGVLSWKLDGLTIVATYNHGHLEKVVTRGDGIIGENITKNALNFQGLPETIPMLPFDGKLVIRAEAVMSYEEFERINDTLPVDAEPYKNPRNLAAGTVRMLNGIGDRIVETYAFEMVDMENGKPASVVDQFAQLAKYGIQVVDYRVVKKATLKSAIEDLERAIPENAFPSDGLVLTYEDSVYAENLGVTGKYPRGSIAFKWQDEEFKTILREIEWSSSATGLLNPVAVFDPVEIEGTTVSKASVHNVSYAENLKLGYGDTIEVYKANKIIPQLSANLTQSNTMNVPAVCPACGGETTIHSRITKEREVRTLVCVNPECVAKHMGRFQRFVCRDAMNIVGISGKTLKRFVDKGFLRSLMDIYRLEEHREEIESMEGFGEKSADNIFAAIEESRTVEPWRFLYAMNIPNVGRDASKKIIRFSGGTFEGFLEKLRMGESFQGAADVGNVTDQSIYDWKQKRGYVDDMADLLDLMSFVANEDNSSTVLEGKNIVITGSLEAFKNREAFIAFVESNGGKVVGSVSKKTTYLVNNDAFSSSSKNVKARALGIPILNELEFKNMVLGE